MQRKKKGIVRILARAVLMAVMLLVLISALPMIALRIVDPPTTAFMIRFEESSGRPGKYQWADWEDISPQLPLAVMAAEDQRFPKHFGLDLEQIMDAIQANESRTTPRGASTITQQTIKNLFLSPERSYLRKGTEAYLALWMELLIPKKRILEIYLNIAQLGPREFGAEAASGRHFGIPARALSPRQAALLAASLPTPSVSSPGRPSEYLEGRADFLLGQMWRLEQQDYLGQIQ
jgi:monofunctional biosynthetic peptidoglycan transglycosylase